MHVGNGKILNQGMNPSSPRQISCVRQVLKLDVLRAVANASKCCGLQRRMACRYALPLLRSCLQSDLDAVRQRCSSSALPATARMCTLKFSHDCCALQARSCSLRTELQPEPARDCRTAALPFVEPLSACWVAASDLYIFPRLIREHLAFLPAQHVLLISLHLSWHAIRTDLPPARIPHKESTHNTSRNTHTTENRHTHKTFLGDLVVDELAQVSGLEVGGLALEEEVVVAAGLGVVAELVVAEGEVVEAFAAALGGDAEDIRE